MDVLSKEMINIILPILVVVLTLLIKLLVNHNFTWIGLGKEMIILPGDISILSISFITSAILVISNKGNNELLLNAIVCLLIFFCMTLIAFPLSKKAYDIYSLDNKKLGDWFSLFGLILISYIISVVIVYIATIFLLTGVNIND
ncbi:hypothetical protein D3D03_09165 [Exiguobacterium sp. RIT452]|uniref:Uncharacterized protein n=1 Tax=Exiguobacterium undae TaxID=169177 RepID=A0ABX2V716_9BACL|nr:MULTISPECIES: hypothetical protein [Exiguobacterium]OAN12718.1 hypothetical protein A3783_10370 [Exiguobacterium undae]RJO98906.1 hypothetical protein D3D03_09165 [Exiguobacterium sp. RIT452]